MRTLIKPQSYLGLVDDSKLLVKHGPLISCVDYADLGEEEMWGKLASARPLVGVLPLLLYPATVWAAGPSRLPSTSEPGHEQPTLPSIPEGQFEFSIPTPRKSPIPKDVENLRFPIKDIVVEGETVFGETDFDALIAPLIGQEKSLAEVMAVAEAIEAKYRDAGYLLTRAFVPPQRSKIGVFKIKVVEGFIKDIVIEGVDGDLKSRITSMLAFIQSEHPIKAATVERALLLVNELPGIKAAGLLKPSNDDVGAADMMITVVPQLVEGSAGIDNRGSRYSGPWTSNADLAVNSLLGQGEQIGFGVTRSVSPYKQRGFRTHYTQPLGSDGLSTQTSFDRSFAAPGWTLKESGVRTTSTNIGQRVSYPVLRSRKENLLLDGGFTVKSAKSDVNDAALSTDYWRVLDTKASWSQNGWLGGGTAATVGMAKGVTMAGSSHKGNANLSRTNADPAFTKFTFDGKRVQPLWSEWSLLFGVAGQYASNKLLAAEEFTLGGSQFGRGYDPSALTGDHGVAGTLEVHYDTETGLPVAETAQVYSFYDQGAVWNRDHVETGYRLSSIGVGMKTTLNQGVTVGMEYAHGLHGPDSTVSADPGRLYFSLQGRF